SLVVTNLLSNAITYTPDGGSVTLGLRRAADGDDAEVFCRDTGIGISPEDQERILTGYYRTESGRKAAKGFGVGLALANSLVGAHGSRLEIDSAPGHGSTFRFRLPLWKEEPAALGLAKT
ncbi:MAG: ATP-binding protein, partial [Elusimicrobia bacterium]|nr:ATP-binding protein [Elusimicrobiota bacterium]